MVKIRLKRLGKKEDPFYRIVAIEEGSKRSGQDLGILGFWHPSDDTKEVDLKEIQKWVSKGAQITPAVKKLMEAK
ncbi:MAG TPA: 30S ribosomal protein S16 [Patescibacteria group bacterium]